jgi:hypothetical protein
VKSWWIPKAPARCVAKMEDGLSVYQRPYDARFPQVCLDEIHKTLRSIPRGELPSEPGQAHRVAQKLQWHYKPEHARWLNIAECELSVLRRQCLNQHLPDIETVQAEVAAWEQARNSAHVLIDWRFTTDDARIKLKRLYPVINVQKSTYG